MGRALGFIVVAIVLAIVIIVAVYIGLSRRSPRARPEIDQGRTPAHWLVYSRSIDGTGRGDSPRTEVGIQRVADDDGRVLERRARDLVDCYHPDYDDQLDDAMERAYQASIKADTYERRR